MCVCVFIMSVLVAALMHLTVEGVTMVAKTNTIKN